MMAAGTKSVILITRVATEDDLARGDLVELLSEAKSFGIDEQDMYVVLKAREAKNSQHKVGDMKVWTIHDDDPTGPTSMNSTLSFLREKSKSKPSALLIASSEVRLRSKDIKRLEDELFIKESDDNNILIVGYKFNHVDGTLDKCLQDCYKKQLAAYVIPWNTCALWNFSLFDKYVQEFDDVTRGVGLVVQTTMGETPLKGMEDGLAIAKGVSRGRLHYKLLDSDIIWDVKRDNNDHLRKLTRKDMVLLHFMTTRGYSVADLIKARL